jgi:very-short-patch-repair endonuclease
MSWQHLKDACGDAMNLSGAAEGAELPLKAKLGSAYFVLGDAIDESRARASSLGIGGANLDRCIDAGTARVEYLLQYTESPIEKAMCGPLVFADYRGFLDYPAAVHAPKDEKSLPAAEIVIIPQFAFVKYRLDFAVLGRYRAEVKIVGFECDGAAFHTNDGSDVVRDRYFASFGIEIVRATGSQIASNPILQARRVAHILSTWRAEREAANG